MGSLNWVLGEQLSQVIVSTWLHGHGEHRWGRGSITMHKQMDMRKCFASLFPLPPRHSDFTLTARWQGMMSVSANTLMCHNSLTPLWWCDEGERYLLHLVNINKRGCFLAFKWELKECNLAQQLDSSPWNLTQSSSYQTPIERIYDWSVYFETWQNQKKELLLFVKRLYA